MDNAGNSQVWLEISGIEGYRYYAKVYEPISIGRNHLYIPQYDVSVNKGVFNKESPWYHQTVLPISNEILLNGIYNIIGGSKWASFNPIQIYYGTLSPKETIQILEQLKSMHDDDIRGVKRSQSGGELISFDDLIRMLGAHQKRWNPVELP